MGFLSASPPAPVSTGSLACRLCGAGHAPIALAPGQRAMCVRCGTILAKRGLFGPHAPLAFSVTGVVLSVPALALPFITVAKFGNTRANALYSGAVALWEDGMRVLAVWVFICGTLAPVLLFGLLAALIGARRDITPAAQRQLLRGVHALEHWAMPEVLVLAVLVALIKLGTLVNVFIGPGFWCYAAMSVVLLFAWRSFEFEVTGPASQVRRGGGPA